MKFGLLLLSGLLTSAIFCQSQSITADTLWIHKANPDDDDINSIFPILKSTASPTVAEAINTVLQMKVLGFTLTAKHKADLMKPTTNPLDRRNLDFSVTPIGKKVIRVSIGTFQTINNMSLNGYYNQQSFYFDITNGIEIRVSDLFTQQGYNEFRKAVVTSLKKDFIKIMQTYKEGFSENDIPSLSKECECDCMKYLDDAVCSQSFQLTMDDAKHSLAFSIPDCDWMNPRRHDLYQGELALTLIRPMLSQLGKNVLLNEKNAVNDDSIFRLWKGTIGKIPVHFLLDPNDACLASGIEGSGLEIYDKYGTNVSMSWGRPGNGLNVTLKELSSDGQTLATIQATLNGDMLSGTWQKADGTSTLPFEATRVNR